MSRNLTLNRETIGRSAATILLGGAIIGACAAAPLGVRGGSFTVDWYTVDGGGATFTSGGGFTLGSTIGQPDAGPVMNGGGFQLIGGFWATQTSGTLVECPADLDGDGIVDGSDLGILLSNWGGDGDGDLNQDGLVDGADLGELLGAWGDCPG